jgi:hypothetical protein
MSRAEPYGQGGDWARVFHRLPGIPNLAWGKPGSQVPDHPSRRREWSRRVTRLTGLRTVAYLCT